MVSARAAKQTQQGRERRRAPGVKKATKVVGSLSATKGRFSGGRSIIANFSGLFTYNASILLNLLHAFIA